MKTDDGAVGEEVLAFSAHTHAAGGETAGGETAGVETAGRSAVGGEMSRCFRSMRFCFFCRSDGKRFYMSAPERSTLSTPFILPRRDMTLFRCSTLLAFTVIFISVLPSFVSRVLMLCTAT